MSNFISSGDDEDCGVGGNCGGSVKNTDRELWREREGDYYAAHIFVTQAGAIGINVGGHVIVAPIQTWHKALFAPAPPRTP